MITDNTRLSRGNVIQEVDAVTGENVGYAFVDLLERYSVTSPDDTLVTIKESDTWGSLGLTRLGDARHNWVILDLSGVIDPFSEISTGSVIRVPAAQRLLFDILTT